ncbi:MAG: hypothetical protein JXQ27_14355 [Acidobacteria bacterium]|nr:hypothetical protein [Acidobacteriota bacterium]
MTDLQRLEEFLVHTDDVSSLMELYATRIKSYPLNRAYYEALALQCGEFLLATKRLRLKSVLEAVQALYRLANVLNDRGLAASSRHMEVFLLELHDLTNYFRKLFQHRDLTRKYESANLMLLQNMIRQLSVTRRPAVAPVVTSEQEIVEDPFDEIEGLGDFVDSFADDLDRAFDAIVSEEEASPHTGTGKEFALTAAEQSQVENLFLSISSAYIQPVKDFISQLSGGSVSKHWVDICLGSLRIIEDAGTKMSYEKINSILVRFKQFMMEAKSAGGATISREIRLQLLKEYANLTALMPETFATSDDHASPGSMKDGVIINVLLRRTPGVGPISRNKLIAAGLNTLEKYYMASADDIAAVSGVSLTQAESIRQAFAGYREHLRTSTGLTTQVQVSLTRLYRHLRTLKKVHEDYKQATRRALYDPDRQADRERLREKRQTCMWEINIIMAELNQLRMIEDFRKMIFDRRIEFLDQFMEEQAKQHF